MTRFLTAAIAALVLTGCGAGDAIKATHQMPDKMDRMLAEMERTNRTVELQPTVLTFEAMLKPEYGRDLIPVPFDLMPFAKKFADYAKPDELVELVYLWVKKLNDVTLDSGLGGTETREQLNQRKLQAYAALQAVCGFIPDDKIEAIIREHVYGTSRYQDSALQLLMLRVMFLRDVLLENTIFDKPMDNVGKLEKAIEYADDIEFIARQPFAGHISVEILGFLDPIPAVREQLRPAQAADIWTKIKTKAARALTVTEKAWTGDPALDRQRYQNEKARMDRAVGYVDQKLRSWNRLR